MPYTYRYPRMAVTVDVALIAMLAGEPHLLLIRRSNPPFAGHWALPGGFVDMNETAQEAARRELREETGVDDQDLHFFGYFDAIDRDPRGRTISFAFLACADTAPLASGADDASEAAYFPLNKLPKLAFDHAEVTTAAIKAWRTRR